MFVLLMKIRLLSAKNVLREALQRTPLVSGGMSLFGMGLFVLMYLGFLLFFHTAARLNVLTETVYQIFYFLFLFLLAGAVPFVASTLLHSSDYALLFAAPLPPRAVVAAKLLDATVTNSLQFTVLGIPAIVACASVLGLSPLLWLLVPALIVLFVLLPALITAFGLLVALACLGMKRLRAAITLLNALMAIGVCITIVLESGQMPLKPGMWINPQAAIAPAIASTSPAAHFSPSAWFAQTLLGFGGETTNTLLGLEALGKILLLVGLLFAGCLFLGGRLLSAANVAEEQDDGGVVSDSGRSGNFWYRLFGAPVAAIMAKDFKYLLRDSVLLSQLTMPMILFLVPFLLAFQDTSLQFHEEMFPFCVGMIGVILFMQTSILSLSSIGLESRSFWVVHTSPNGARILLRAKFLLCTILSFGIGTLLTLAAGAVFHSGLTVIGIQLVLILFCSAGLCGLGIGISAAFPRFLYENPAHRVSAWAMILGFFASIGYLTFTGLIFGVIWFVTTQSGNENASLLYGLGSVLFVVFTLYSIFLALTIGAKRLAKYQWEH